MSTQPAAPSIETIKAAQRAVWMAGDFGKVASTFGGGSGDDFASRILLPPGPCRLLDVACGTGNLTLPLAKSLAKQPGSTVTGLDIAPNLLEQARARAAAVGLAIRFDEGDAEALPYPDASFDVVVTMFGAMFAPRPELVASELARVLKPGGRLAMANWTPAGFNGKMFKLGSQHVPPPPGIPPPVLWGDDATVRARLAAGFTDIQTTPIEIDFDMPMSPAECVTFFRTYFGPTQTNFARLDDAGKARLAADLEALWSTNNIAANPTSHTVVHNEYLQVFSTRRQ